MAAVVVQIGDAGAAAGALLVATGPAATGGDVVGLGAADTPAGVRTTTEAVTSIAASTEGAPTPRQHAEPTSPASCRSTCVVVPTTVTHEAPSSARGVVLQQ